MSIARDKRINKLKKQHIWPSLLILMIIVIILFALVTGIMAMSYIGVVDRKIQESYIQSERVAKLFKDVPIEQIQSVNEENSRYIQMFDDVKAISIIDHNDEVIWSSGEEYPDIQKCAKYYDFKKHENNEFINIVIYEDDNEVFTLNEDIYEVNNNIYSVIPFKELFITLDSSLNLNRRIIDFRLWMEIPMGNYSIYVLNNIPIYDYDLLFLIIIMVLVMVLVFVFSIYYIISLVNIVRSQRKITKILYTDIATGGNNWIYFVKKASKILKRNSNRNSYAMVTFSMDKYRSFCTCFGVKEGQELIEKLYRILKKNINKNELIAYRENADFAMFIMYNDKDDIISRLDNLGKLINTNINNFKLYFSAGVCLIDDTQKDIDGLYNNAIIAKSMLGDDIDQKVAFFDIEMNKQQLWERKIEDDMDKALVTREFKVYLQPKYSTNDEKLSGAEALVRWVHSTEGLIPPNRFIPIFEQNGFILQLDDYMLEEVAGQQAKWIAEGKKVFPISVNISRAHFTREDLAEHVCEIVDKYNIPHNIIELELTESAFFDDKPVLIETVRKLKEYGFIVSMDDFGAGFSSLNSLKELPIDVLKIDADFFKDTGSVDRGLLIVSEVIDLGKKLDMKIVAEGIENREQVNFLAEQECDLIQGYYFAKPMPIEEFEKSYFS